MPILYVNGLEPSVGQMLRSFWNIVTFHMSSYMICGSFTGWVDGQEPPPVAPLPL